MTTTTQLPTLLVYDTEITDIGDKSILRHPESLTLGVACTWDRVKGYRDWFDADTEHLVAYMCSFDYLVGYNNLRFDNPVILSSFNSVFNGAIIDLFADIHEATGRMHGLKTVANDNLYIPPASDVDGAAAPKMWASGKRLEVIRYCRKDVDMTRALLRKLVAEEPLILKNKYQTPKRRNVPIHERTANERKGIDYEIFRQLCSE